MTTANTNRALKATQTIEQLGGLQRAEWGDMRRYIGAEDVRTVLELFARLKLDVPKELADVLTETATICQRAHKLKTAPTLYTADDLAAEDYEQRFTNAMTGQLRVLAKADDLINRAKATAIEQAVRTIRQQAQPLIKLLNTAYRKYADGDLGRTIRDAHRGILLPWHGGTAPIRIEQDYTAQWCLTWAWTQEAWNKLADDTAAQMEIPRSWTGTSFDFAVACGGKPYLSPSTADAFDRALHHRQQYRIWQEDRRNERAQEHAREQIDQQTEQARQQQERQLAEARRLAAAAAVAEAD